MHPLTQRLSLLLALVVGAVLSWAAPVFAKERILAYDVHVRVADDGELHVRERIRASTQGIQIVHGIYRDFPLLFRDDDGVHTVGFLVDDVQRDGTAEPYELERTRSVARVRIGSADVDLEAGEHTWEVAYRTNRQIRFFATHDELNWNATGTEWIFPIDHVRVTIALPENAVVTATNVFTGALGANGKAAQLVSQDDHVLVFETTAPLDLLEGLTVVVGMEKGAITPPSEEQLSAWWWEENNTAVAAGVILLATLLWYALWWVLRRRDAPRGVVMPRWAPPAGLSALRVRIVERRRLPFHVDLMTLSLVELAAHRAVAFEKGTKKTTVLIPQPQQLASLPPSLPAELHQLASSIAAHAGPIHMNAAAAPWFAEQREALKNASDAWLNQSGLFTQRNWVSHLGVILSFGALAVTAMMDPTTDGAMIAITIGFGLLLCIADTDVLRGLVSFGRFRDWVKYILLMVFSGGMLALMLWAMSENGNDVACAVVGILLVWSHWIILPARRVATVEGRKTLDEIEGLRMYISLAEADRMNMTGAPQMSILHFERLLPYAMALGLEKPWTGQFADWMNRVGVQPEPGLSTYFLDDGVGRSPFGAGGMGRGIEYALAASLTASLPVVASMSSGLNDGGGGGGGGSGGGGGGGGGGGW